MTSTTRCSGGYVTSNIARKYRPSTRSVPCNNISKKLAEVHHIRTPRTCDSFRCVLSSHSWNSSSSGSGGNSGGGAVAALEMRDCLKLISKLLLKYPTFEQILNYAIMLLYTEYVPSGFHGRLSKFYLISKTLSHRDERLNCKCG